MAPPLFAPARIFCPYLRHPLAFFTRPVFPCIKCLPTHIPCKPLLVPCNTPASVCPSAPAGGALQAAGTRLLHSAPEGIPSQPHLPVPSLLPSHLYRSTSHLLGRFTAFLRSSLPPEFFVVAYTTMLSMRHADARPNLCFRLLCNLSRVHSFHPFWSLTPLDKMKEVQKSHDT